MFLENHPEKYNISFEDAKLALITGLSGAPFANRHHEIASRLEGRDACFHQALATIESIPILGALTAVIEKIVYVTKELFSSFFFPSGEESLLGRGLDRARQILGLSVDADDNNPIQLEGCASWRTSFIDSNKAFLKMVKNTLKATAEHFKKDHDAYASFEQVSTILKNESQHALNPLTCTFFTSESRGRRFSMEDATFFEQTDDAAIIGVLDGHGGKEVASLVASEFPNRFFDALADLHGNVHQAFERVFDGFQNDILLNDDFRQIGSTAVISYIDKKQHRIYTATLGDSEANLYRTIDEKMKSIPLSCVRDWGSVADAKRAALYLDDPNIALSWPQTKNPKTLRLSCYNGSINVSRSFGDSIFSGDKERPGVIHKPKITVNMLKQGDRVVLACDGLKDYVPESKIIDVVQATSLEDVAKTLVHTAIDECNSSDNVSIAVVEIN